jgi:hypothetical protein
MNEFSGSQRDRQVITTEHEMSANERIFRRRSFTTIQTIIIALSLSNNWWHLGERCISTESTLSSARVKTG